MKSISKSAYDLVTGSSPSKSFSNAKSSSLRNRPLLLCCFFMIGMGGSGSSEDAISLIKESFCLFVVFGADITMRKGDPCSISLFSIVKSMAIGYLETSTNSLSAAE